MNEISSSILLQQTNSRTKRMSQQPVSITTKKLRSKIPRRKRFRISPILTESSNSLLCDDKLPELSGLQADSSSSSCFPGEISSKSTWISVDPEVSNKKSRSIRLKRKFEDVSGREVSFQEVSRPITRSYLRQKEIEREVKEKCYGDSGIELSESSCVESSSRAGNGAGEFSQKNLKLIDRGRNVLQKESQFDVNRASESVSLSGISCVQPKNDPIIHEQGDRENEVSTISLLDSYSEVNNNQALSTFTDVFREETKGAPEWSYSEVTGNFVETNVTSANFNFTVDQKPKDIDLEYSLTCSEILSYEDNSESSLNELDSDLFPITSSLEFSDLTPSMLDDSLGDSSQASDKTSDPPLYFPFFLEFQKQFCKLNSSIDIEASDQVQPEFYDEFTLLRFENQEYEESYMKFRRRERKLVLPDFSEEYSSTTDYGDLVIRQRYLMVNWIVEQSEALELHSETLFLGISLFDRCLSRGFFKHRRNLQILGIACLTLARRLEENQPYNSVRQRAFYVGKNQYSRPEVIGMEWLVQEILNFQCFLPTIYNFLWFYLRAAKANAEVEKRTKYLAVLSLLSHERLWYWPSTVAAGLVILASLASNQESSCQWVMETHVRTKDDDLPECIKSLDWLVKHV
ncbi:hypothetical protein ACHQM5_005519 [Ranunculus cassubicifolius]